MEIKVKSWWMVYTTLIRRTMANGTTFEPRKTFTLMRAISHTFRNSLILTGQSVGLQ